MAMKLLVTLALLAAAASAEESLGNVATIEDFPSLAQVEFRVGFWVQQCACSIITNRHILTLAACFSGPLYLREYRRIRVGASQRSTDGIILGVESEALHPSFGLLEADADIAVVRLDDYVTFDSTIQQVSIIGQGIVLPIGLDVRTAGWGTTSQGGDTSNADLYSLSLLVSSNEQCLEKYFGSQTITENMVCVRPSGVEGRDFDSRDSGAPLFYEDSTGRYLVGLLAFGEREDDQFPLVATNIGSFTDWIIVSAV